MFSRKSFFFNKVWPAMKFFPDVFSILYQFSTPHKLLFIWIFITSPFLPYVAYCFLIHYSCLHSSAERECAFHQYYSTPLLWSNGFLTILYVLLPNNFLHSVSLVTFPVWETSVFNYWGCVALGVTQLIRAVMAACSPCFGTVFLAEGGHQSAPGLGLRRISPLWTTPFWFHRCVQFTKPFPDAEAEQVCCLWCAVPTIPKPAMVGNVPPSPLHPVPCPGFTQHF